MKKILLLLIGASALISTPALSMTDADCKMTWSKADANKDGVLNSSEADRYFSAMRVANKTIPENGEMSDSIYMENCKAGVFTMAKVENGAPFAGANSFTEGQAKDRIMAAGYTSLTNLKKDDKGIWRGTAQQGDKSVDVAVDFKGNVVTN